MGALPIAQPVPLPKAQSTQMVNAAIQVQVISNKMSQPPYLGNTQKNDVFMGGLSLWERSPPWVTNWQPLQSIVMFDKEVNLAISCISPTFLSANCSQADLSMPSLLLVIFTWWYWNIYSTDYELTFLNRKPKSIIESQHVPIWLLTSICWAIDLRHYPSISPWFCKPSIRSHHGFHPCVFIH